MFNSEQTYFEGSNTEIEMEDESWELPHTISSNGDIRLASFIGDEDENFLSGRLEIYVDTILLSVDDDSSGDGLLGSWGSVCGVGFSLVEAHVACRQLGYVGALDWKLSSKTE